MYKQFVVLVNIVYPQEVTGSTVVTDQDKYSNWLISQPDDVFEKIRMQGHSHVKMGTTPSTTDITGEMQILNQLADDMFYIFMIWNKSFEKNVKIYDMKKNILFETSDVSVSVMDTEDDLSEFLRNAKENVVEYKYTYTPTTTKTTEKKEEDKKETSKKKKTADTKANYIDQYEDMCDSNGEFQERGAEVER